MLWQRNLGAAVNAHQRAVPPWDQPMRAFELGLGDARLSDPVRMGSSTLVDGR